jgi:aspartyl-tRNA(Asn)/glutamyl-tRNA(Gln) amidotransferase subunit C
MVDKNIVEYVANLARIDISPQEKELLTAQLSKIIEYINKLKELNLKRAEPLRCLRREKEVLRDDRVKVFSSKEDILDNAPSREEGYFKIPQVIE